MTFLDSPVTTSESTSLIRPWPDEIPVFRGAGPITTQRASEMLHEAHGHNAQSLSHPFLDTTTRDAEIYLDIRRTGNALIRAVHHPDRLSEIARAARVSDYISALREIQRVTNREIRRISNRSITSNSPPSLSDFTHQLSGINLPRFRISRTGIIRWEHQPIIPHYNGNYILDTPVVTISINASTFVHQGILESISFSPCMDFPTLPFFTASGGYIHPHLSGSNFTPCWGQARLAIVNAWNTGSMPLVCQIINSFLNSYGTDPYCALENFVAAHPLNDGTVDIGEDNSDEDDDYDSDDEDWSEEDNSEGIPVLSRPTQFIDTNSPFTDGGTGNLASSQTGEVADTNTPSILDNVVSEAPNEFSFRSANFTVNVNAQIDEEVDPEDSVNNSRDNSELGPMTSSSYMSAPAPVEDNHLQFITITSNNPTAYRHWERNTGVTRFIVPTRILQPYLDSYRHFDGYRRLHSFRSVIDLLPWSSTSFGGRSFVLIGFNENDREVLTIRAVNDTGQDPRIRDIELFYPPLRTDS